MIPSLVTPAFAQFLSYMFMAFALILIVWLVAMFLALWVEFTGRVIDVEIQKL
jgi:hypothetical protein